MAGYASRLGKSALKAVESHSSFQATPQRKFRHPLCVRHARERPATRRQPCPASSLTRPTAAPYRCYLLTRKLSAGRLVEPGELVGEQSAQKLFHFRHID